MLNWSTVATSSARRTGWLSGRTWTAMPIFTRRVRAVRAAATTSGEARTERPFWKCSCSIIPARKFDFEPAPLVLAKILGPQLEVALRRSLIYSRAAASPGVTPAS